MTFVRCFALIFAQCFREMLVSKKAIFFLISSMIYPAVLGISIGLLSEHRRADELFAGVTLGIYWQALVPLASIFFAVSAVRDEISSRTLVYLISGPVPRASIWLGKFAASVGVSWIVLGAGYLVARVLVPQVVAHDFRGATIAASTLAAPIIPLIVGPAAYCAIGTLCGVWFKRAMIAGAIYVVGWEYAVGSTPAQAGVRTMTVIDSVRTMFYQCLDESAAPHFRRAMREWTTGGMIRRMESFEMPTIADALTNVGILAGVALLLALWLGSRKDFDTASTDG